MARLGLAMMDAGVARPEDWRGRTDEFISRTLDRWVEEAGGHRVAGYFGLFVRLSRTPGGMDLETGDRCYLEVWQTPGDHYGLMLGPAIRKLEAIDRRFPSMFWQRYTYALRSIGVDVWDPLWALEMEDDWLGDYVHEGAGDEGDDEDREEYLNEHLPSRVVPESLRRGWVKDDTVTRALRQRGVSPESWEGKLLYGALDLYAEAARGGVSSGWRALTEQERAAFMDHGESAPSLIAVIEDGDAIAHLIDMHGDSLMQSGMDLPPSCVWGFDVDNAGVVAAHSALRQFLGVCLRAVDLIPLLEYPDGLPLSKTLGVRVRA